MRPVCAFFVLALIAMIGIPTAVSEGALSAAAGGSGLSGTLAKNKALRKQQLICDPNEPTGGSTSVNYDPNVVSLGGLSFGPGYSGFGYVEIDNGEGTSLYNINSYLAEPFGTETGYVQILFTEKTTPPTGVITSQAVVIPPLHGQIPVAAGYAQIDQDGPVSVDTHALVFNYLSTASDDAVANYKIWASETRGVQEDYLEGFDGQNPYRVGFADIVPANVSGSLNVVPLPPAVWMGGATLLGAMYAMKRRKVVA